MENSWEYTLFIKNFVENILLSLNCDYNKYISFNKKDSILEKKLDYSNIDNIISRIAYNLLINGKQVIYLYDKNTRIVVSLKFYENEKIDRKFTIRFPKKVMTTFTRKRILNSLKKMTYPQGDNVVDKNYPRDSLFLMNLMGKASLKLTKKYVSVNTNLEKCTDQYILFREIRKRKYQKMLVSHIFDELNKQFHKVLKIDDEDDNIIFVSQSLEELNKIEEDLLNDNKTVGEVLKILYPSSK